MLPTEKEMYEAYRSGWTAHYNAILTEEEARSALKTKVEAISQADWNKQYCSSTADIERRTWLGRLCKWLRLSRSGCVKNRFCDADLKKAAPIVHTSLKAFVLANHPISPEQRALAQRAITSFNALLERYDKAVPEKKKLPQDSYVKTTDILPPEAGAMEDCTPDWAQTFYEETKYLTLAQKARLIQMVRAGSNQFVIAKFVRKYNASLDEMKQLSPLHAKLPQEAYLNEEEIFRLATQPAEKPEPRIRIRGASVPPRDTPTKSPSTARLEADERARQRALRQAERTKESQKRVMKDAQETKEGLVKVLLRVGCDKKHIEESVKLHNDHLDTLKGISPDTYTTLDKSAYLDADEILECARAQGAPEPKKRPIEEAPLSASAPATPRSDSDFPPPEVVLRDLRSVLGQVNEYKAALEKFQQKMDTLDKKLGEEVKSPSPVEPSIPTSPVVKEAVAEEPLLPVPFIAPTEAQPSEHVTAAHVTHAEENAMLFSHNNR